MYVMTATGWSILKPTCEKNYKDVIVDDRDLRKYPGQLYWNNGLQAFTRKVETQDTNNHWNSVALQLSVNAYVAALERENAELKAARIDRHNDVDIFAPRRLGSNW